MTRPDVVTTLDGPGRISGPGRLPEVAGDSAAVVGCRDHIRVEARPGRAGHLRCPAVLGLGIGVVGLGTR